MVMGGGPFRGKSLVSNHRNSGARHVCSFSICVCRTHFRSYNSLLHIAREKKTTKSNTKNEWKIFNPPILERKVESPWTHQDETLSAKRGEKGKQTPPSVCMCCVRVEKWKAKNITFHDYELRAAAATAQAADMCLSLKNNKRTNYEVESIWVRRRKTDPARPRRAHHISAARSTRKKSPGAQVALVLYDSVEREFWSLLGKVHERRADTRRVLWGREKLSPLFLLGSAADGM